MCASVSRRAIVSRVIELTGLAEVPAPPNRDEAFAALTTRSDLGGRSPVARQTGSFEDQPQEVIDVAELLTSEARDQRDHSSRAANRLRRARRSTSTERYASRFATNAGGGRSRRPSRGAPPGWIGVRGLGLVQTPVERVGGSSPSSPRQDRLVRAGGPPPRNNASERVATGRRQRRQEQLGGARARPLRRLAGFALSGRRGMIERVAWVAALSPPRSGLISATTIHTSAARHRGARDGNPVDSPEPPPSQGPRSEADREDDADQRRGAPRHRWWRRNSPSPAEAQKAAADSGTERSGSGVASRPGRAAKSSPAVTVPMLAG